MVAGTGHSVDTGPPTPRTAPEPPSGLTLTTHTPCVSHPYSDRYHCHINYWRTTVTIAAPTRVFHDHVSPRVLHARQ